MKKLFICLILFILGLCSWGQGTANITKSHCTGYSQMIRQYSNFPGYHVVYFADAISGRKGYIGITDIFNTIKYVQICDNCTIKDIEVLGNYVYFCGQTATNNGVLGWVNLQTMTESIDSTSLTATSLDNIEVYSDAVGNNYIAGFGTNTYGHIGFEYFEQTGYYVYFTLPYVPRDITTTDNFVVLAGDFSTSGTVNVFAIQPFPKNIIPPAYLPYYSYAVGNPPTMVEPYNYHLRIVDIGNDDVATLTHRLDYVSGIYYMALREYDVSNAFSNYDVPMTASYLMKYNYSIGDYHDFRYDAANMTFSVFQDFEVTPSNNHDVVTKINFSSGVPATVQSDYLALSSHVMKSMSLSDSVMYAVYGYDAVSKANVFWKDYQTISVPGSCLNNAVLPFYTDTPVSVERVDMNIFTPLPASLSIINSAPVIISERIVNICH